MTGEYFKDPVSAHESHALSWSIRNIITRSPAMYLRAGILDSLAKWYEGRSVIAKRSESRCPNRGGISTGGSALQGPQKICH